MRKDKTIKPHREHIIMKLLSRLLSNLLAAVIGGGTGTLIIYYLLTK